MSRMCRPKWPYLLMYGSHNMRHVEFRGLTGSQRTPRDWGVTACEETALFRGRVCEESRVVALMILYMY